MLVIYRVQYTCTDLQLDRALRRLAVFPHLAITRIQNGHGEQTCGEMGFLKPWWSGRGPCFHGKYWLDPIPPLKYSFIFNTPRLNIFPNPQAQWFQGMKICWIILEGYSHAEDSFQSIPAFHAGNISKISSWNPSFWRYIHTYFQGRVYHEYQWLELVLQNESTRINKPCHGNSKVSAALRNKVGRTGHNKMR